MAFDAYGTRGAVGWNLEQLNELRRVPQSRRPADRGSGYTTVLGGDRFRHHGAFVPGSGNPIGFEDLVTIEDHEFCTAVSRGPAVRARVRAGAGVGGGARGAAALGAERHAGSRWSRCDEAAP